MRIIIMQHTSFDNNIIKLYRVFSGKYIERL